MRSVWRGDHTNTTDLTHLPIGWLDSILVSFMAENISVSHGLGSQCLQVSYQAIIVSENKPIFRDTNKKGPHRNVKIMYLLPSVGSDSPRWDHDTVVWVQSFHDTQLQRIRAQNYFGEQFSTKHEINYSPLQQNKSHRELKISLSFMNSCSEPIGTH